MIMELGREANVTIECVLLNDTHREVVYWSVLLPGMMNPVDVLSVTEHFKSVTFRGAVRRDGNDSEQNHHESFIMREFGFSLDGAVLYCGSQTRPLLLQFHLRIYSKQLLL